MLLFVNGKMIMVKNSIVLTMVIVLPFGVGVRGVQFRKIMMRRCDYDDWS